MSDDTPNSRRGDYRLARIGAASALVFALVVLLFVDAASEAYEVSPTVLGTLGAMILALLSVEVANIIRKGQ